MMKRGRERALHTECNLCKLSVYLGIYLCKLSVCLLDQECHRAWTHVHNYGTHPEWMEVLGRWALDQAQTGLFQGRRKVSSARRPGMSKPLLDSTPWASQANHASDTRSSQRQLLCKQTHNSELTFFLACKKMTLVSEVREMESPERYTLAWKLPVGSGGCLASGN